MRRYNKHRRRTLGLEPLENRQLLAGDVQVFFEAITGDLLIQGDSSPNAVDVRGTGVPGEVLITPLEDQATGQPTTVNGSSSPLVLSGVNAGVSAAMREGNDEFYLRDYAFNSDGRFFGDAGADTIRIGNWVAYGTAGTGDVSFTGEIYMDEQRESLTTEGDYIFLGRVTVNERIFLWSGRGADYIEFYDVKINGNNLEGYPYTLMLNAEEEYDVVNLAYTTVHGKMKLDVDGMDHGNDVVSIITSVFHDSAYINAWEGSNTVALNANQFLSTLEIYSERGQDTIRLTNSFCNKKITITGVWQENGNDSVTIQGNTISERLYIWMGGGNDTIVVTGNQIVTAGIYSSTGYDGVIVRYNVFYGHVDINGGSEYDILYFSGNLFYSTYAYYYFESIQA
jgi:hypothetical protein